MPAEIQTTDNQQRSSMDKMAATAQKSSGDPGQTTPALTYALAAKGRSPSVPSLLPNGKALSDTTENALKRSPSSGSRDTSANSIKPPTERTASDNRTPQVEDVTPGEEQQRIQHTEFKDVTKSDNAGEKQPSAAQPQPMASIPSSPEYGNTSTSTLPKEDDAFSTVNGSSESTWDKQSQTSQNGSKGGEKPDAEKEQATKISWDEEAPAPASLKEAPPPPVNIWQQRIAAQKPKQSNPSQLPKPAIPNPSPGNANGPAKGTEATSEQKKQDGKKKGKTGTSPLDERPAVGTPRNGSKATDAADKSTAIPMRPPPPPEDAISWPAPESALNEGKKKAPERVEKDDKDASQAPKPHKEKWVRVPLVHSVVFETPFPNARRGGKLPRGGREGGARGGNIANASNGVEKPLAPGTSTSANQTLPASGLERGRGALNPTTTNANVSKPKRASSAGPATPRNQRKLGDPTAVEKHKEFENGFAKASQSNSNNSNNSNNVKEARRPSVPTTAKDPQPEWSTRVVPLDGAPTPTNSVQNNTDEDKQNLSLASEAPVSSRAAGSERRTEGSIRPPDFARDFPGNVPARERGEGRPERGRGGYRGRGGPNHAFFNSNLPNGHGFTNSQQGQYQQAPATPAKSHSNHESSPSHSQSSYYQPAQQYSRHHRSNSRSQSIPHSTPYGRFSNVHHPGAPHLANLQIDIANEYSYQPGNNGIMSAIPYNPYFEIPVFGMVSMQMEYYFSVDNLCKDIFLRTQMDSQGFVFLSVLAKFNRIKQLTTNYAMIQQVCVNSPNLEYYDPRVDGVDRVRKRDGWQQWVMKVEDRDPSAQNDGPPPRHQYPSMNDPHHTFEDTSAISPRSSAVPNSVENFQFQALDSVAPPYGQAGAIGVSNGADASTIRAPLSAAVSEFSPSVRSSNSRSFSQPDSQAPGTSVFTDEQIDGLNIVVRKPMTTASPTRPHFHSSSSRTFSNGSIDGRSINEELSNFADRQQPVPTMNGDTPDRIQGSRSPFPVSRQIDNNVSPEVLWIKDRQTAITTLGPLPDGCAVESYHDFRRDALKQRERPVADKAHHHDTMQSLYQFWSHFLIRNFNARMYEEFRQFALEDASERESTTGLRNLLKYYDESILGQKTISDDKIARDFVELVRLEINSKERPAFGKLRAVWRNGAYNMKNRSKLSKFLDTDLKSELDR